MAFLWGTILGHCSEILKPLERANFILLSLVASLCFTYFYFLYTHEYPPGSYERIANYDADKVFQTRILVTCMANALEPALPLLQASFQWLVPYPIEYEVLLQGITVCFLAALIPLIPRLCKVMGTPVSPWWGFLCILPLSWNYIFLNGLWDGAGLYYPYDIPSLTLFALGVTLFLQGQWKWFYPCFLIACLNRESACFITMAGVFLLLKPKQNARTFFLENRTILIHLIAQTFLWIFSRVALSHIFKDNPGAFFETPHSMPDFVQRMWTGEAHWAMEKPIRFLCLFGGVWIIPLLMWKKQTSSARKLMFVGFIYLAALCVRSNMMETRVYNELNVILIVAAIIGLHGFREKSRGMQSLSTYP